MTLFAPSELKVKQPTPDPDRRRHILPTGTPRLLEASAARRDRLRAEAWAALLTAVRQSARARLELLKNREGSDRVSCPWGQVVSCAGGCRCGGLQLVTVTFLRAHYAHLATEIADLVRRAS